MEMKKWVVVVSLVFLVVIGCRRSIEIAAGDRGVINVVATEKVLYSVAPYLEEGLCQQRFYPSKETIFDLNLAGPANCKKYRFYKNVLVLGVPGDAFVDSIVGFSPWESMDSIGGVFVLEDVWVPPQVIVLVIAPTDSMLIELVKTRRDDLFSVFVSAARRNVERVIYEKGYQKKVAEKLWNKAGCWLKYPLGYQWRFVEDRFFSLGRQVPVRYLSVAYDTGKVAYDFERLVAWRDSICALYFEGDKVLVSATTGRDTVFKDWQAYRLDGIWQNPEKIMGGPFFTIVFYVPQRDRTYYIAGYVFAPEWKKWFYLQELDIISLSFSVWRNDVQEKEER